MKILIDNRGQTCNKFWSYIYPLSQCIDKGDKYILPYYDKTIKDYPSLLCNPYFKYPFYSSLLNRLFGVDPYMKFIQHFLNNRLYTHETLFRLFPNLVIDGWSLRKKRLSEESKAEIRRLFLPGQKIKDEVDRVFSAERNANDIIVGVHVRRGDYREWREGKYYYSFEQYSTICRKVVSFFAGKKISFFIASNEPFDNTSFGDLNCFTISNGGSSHDLYGLSICDYIIGPPSSFSRFAAFRGDVGIQFITDATQIEIRFRKLDNYAYYENGEPIEFPF